MPKEKRLTHDELKRFKGRRLMGALFSLQYEVFFSGGGAKFAVVVPKRVAARAVDRNRLKRRARAALAGSFVRLPPGLAVVVSARREALHAPSPAIATDIDELLGRLARTVPKR